MKLHLETTSSKSRKIEGLHKTTPLKQKYTYANWNATLILCYYLARQVEAEDVVENKGKDNTTSIETTKVKLYGNMFVFIHSLKSTQLTTLTLFKPTLPKKLQTYNTRENE